ncbi:hypothetical protein B0H10DRAFT_680994 [Mycena sp. CBHHK59/15]|nr:hypothetical protein B0H10DRAFT_680994 [Mycena sp. CBHHK59/15]
MACFWRIYCGLESAPLAVQRPPLCRRPHYGQAHPTTSDMLAITNGIALASFMSSAVGFLLTGSAATATNKASGSTMSKGSAVTRSSAVLRRARIRYGGSGEYALVSLIVGLMASLPSVYRLFDRFRIQVPVPFSHNVALPASPDVSYSL